MAKIAVKQYGYWLVTEKRETSGQVYFYVQRADSDNEFCIAAYSFEDARAIAICLDEHAT